jgi:hypothetical protein
MHLHSQLLISTNTWKYMPSSWYVLTLPCPQCMNIHTQHLIHADTCRHMQIHAKPLKHANTYEYMPSSWYVATNEDTNSGLGTRKGMHLVHAKLSMLTIQCSRSQLFGKCRHMKLHTLLSESEDASRYTLSTLAIQVNTCWIMTNTNTDTFSALILAHTCWNMLCSWYMPTYEDTRPVSILRQMQTHAELSIQTNTADECAALDKNLKCKLMLISLTQGIKCRCTVCADTSHCMRILPWHSHPLKLCRHKQICDKPSLRATTWAKSSADAYKCRHTKSPQYMTTYEDTNTALNAREPMQIHAQLSRQANSC